MDRSEPFDNLRHLIGDDDRAAAGDRLKRHHAEGLQAIRRDHHHVGGR